MSRKKANRRGRDIEAVIQQMFAELTADPSTPPELLALLQRTRADIGYIPPEHKRMKWVKLCDALNGFVRDHYGGLPPEVGPPPGVHWAGLVLAGKMEPKP